MKNRFKNRICQKLSKLEGRIKLYRREDSLEELDSLPLRINYIGV